MPKPLTATSSQLQLAATAIHKLRRGEPLNPKSCTRNHFGPYLSLVTDMHTALRQYLGHAEDDTEIADAMEMYWAAVRATGDDRLVDAVDALDVHALAADQDLQ